MSTPWKRVRVRFGDSGQEEPTDTRVLFRQRVPWVILLGAFAALLCLPAHRYLLQDQADMALHRRPPSWQPDVTGKPADRKRQRRRLASLLRNRPEDVRLQLSGLLLGAADLPRQEARAVHRDGVYDPSAARDPRLEYLDALLDRFPDDRVVTAQALRYYSLNWIRIRRADAWGAGEAPRETVLLAGPAVRRVAEICRRGAALDPDNGYFPTMLAAAHFAGGEDAPAYRALEQAAACGDWSDYAFVEGEAARETLVRMHGDRGLWMHLVPSAAVLLPHFAQVRSAARVAMHAATRAGEQGDHAREHRIRAALARLGSLMRRRADTLIGRLVGAAVVEIAFGTSGKHQDAASSAEREAALRRGREAYLDRVRREAPEHRAALVAEAGALPRFQAAARERAIGEMWDRIVLPATRREALGLVLLANAAGCLALWLLTAALVLGLEARRRPSSVPSPPAGPRAPLLPAGLAALALGAGAIAALDPGAAAWAAAPALALAGATALCLVGRGQPEKPWTARHGAAIVLLALLLGGLAGVGWDAVTNHPGYWRHAIPGYFMLGSYPAVEEVHAYGTHLLSGPAPLAAAVLLAALCAALARRTRPAGLLEGIRVGARAMTGVLATAYLVYALFAAPALHRDAALADRLWQQEIEAVSVE